MLFFLQSSSRVANELHEQNRRPVRRFLRIRLRYVRNELPVSGRHGRKQLDFDDIVESTTQSEKCVKNRMPYFKIKKTYK